MKIKEILKVTQPKEYKKIKNPYKNVNENLSHEDFENLMKHSCYRRGPGGAKRQVR